MSERRKIKHDNDHDELYGHENDDGNGHSDHGNGNGYGHDGDGIVIDFDTGEMTLGDTYQIDTPWYYVSGQTGTYAEDGFTLTWDTHDFYYDFENMEDLGAPLVEYAPSNEEHANEHSFNNAFGVNYENGSDGLADEGYELASGVLTQDDGANFTIEEMDFIDVSSTTNTGNFDDSHNFDYVSMYAFDLDPSTNVLTYHIVYSEDLETWNYDETIYDYDTGDYSFVSNTTDDWDDIEDAGYFEDIDALYIDTYGGFAIDNIEIEGLV